MMVTDHSATERFERFARQAADAAAAPQPRRPALLRAVTFRQFHDAAAAEGHGPVGREALFRNLPAQQQTVIWQDLGDHCDQHNEQERTKW